MPLKLYTIRGRAEQLATGGDLKDLLFLKIPTIFTVLFSFFFSFTKLLLKFFPWFFHYKPILLVVDYSQVASCLTNKNEDRKGKCYLVKVNIRISQRKKKERLYSQLFPGNIFHFPYCSAQLRTLFTFVQTEYCFLMASKSYVQSRDPPDNSIRAKNY